MVIDRKQEDRDQGWLDDHLRQVKHLVRDISRRGNAQNQDRGNNHQDILLVVGMGHWRCRLISKEIISEVFKVFSRLRSMIRGQPHFGDQIREPPCPTGLDFKGHGPSRQREVLTSSR